MNFLADECCDAGLVDALRHEGHDVAFVMESMRGASDTDVLQRAQQEERILLTEDKDFGELVYRLHRTVPGIILLRFDPEDREKKRARLAAFLRHEADRLRQAFVVLVVSQAEGVGCRIEYAHLNAASTA